MSHLWAFVVSLFLLHNAYLWLGQGLVPDTDILALLPENRQDPLLSAAFGRVVDASQQRVVVLVGAGDWPRASRAADSYLSMLRPHDQLVRIAESGNPLQQAGWLKVFQPHRSALMTAEAEASLKNQPATFWVDGALRQLHRPFSGPKLVAWQDDPFGLFGEWLQTRAQETPVRPRDGRLSAGDSRRQYVVLPLVLRQPAFAIETQLAVAPLLAQAQRAARKAVPGAEVITAGVVLHAAAASAQAQKEISTIGLGSLVGIMLLIGFTFRSVKPILWVLLSVAVGCLGAVSLSALVFERIHLLTLVFGTSLIGVAQDYGIYYLCYRCADDASDSRRLLRQLLPALALTLVTTLIGYMALALTPFPGLRQMAFFSVAGLVAAWLTVVCWFPALVRPAVLKPTRLMAVWAHSLNSWPRLRPGLPLFVLTLGMGAFIAAGLYNLKWRDDVRLLQNSPQRLINDQLKLNQLLDLPSPAQFYLVRGASPEAVLRAEEILRQKLDPLIERKLITGYQALSSWVPSAATQERRRALLDEKMLQPEGPLKLLATQLGEDENWVNGARARLLGSATPLTAELFLQSSAGEPLRHLWIGQVGAQHASVVALRGVAPTSLPVLRDTAAEIDGVQWVDKVGEISSLLGDYRRYMGYVVLASYFAVFVLLLPRYRGRSWRVLAPTALASGVTLAAFGVAGVSLQLFHMLALMLVLGIGVDYGIFFQEQPLRRDPAAWLATGISALSTLLSFGLLGLSKTPALRAFGLTLLMGITTVALIVPCFAVERGRGPGGFRNTSRKGAKPALSKAGGTQSSEDFSSPRRPSAA